MNIVARLRRWQRPSTRDWVAAGTIYAQEPEIGPVRAFADADGPAATAHGNPTEDPLKPFGDHPFGLYQVVAVRHSQTPDDFTHYGPVRLLLDPVAGDALLAKKNGRTGLCIHGGPLRDGQLRATNGCLRVDDDAAADLAGAVDIELKAGRSVGYACEEVS